MVYDGFRQEYGDNEVRKIAIWEKKKKSKLGAGTDMTSVIALNPGMKQDFGNLFTSF